MKKVSIVIIFLLNCFTAFTQSADLQLEVHCTSCNGEEVTLKMYNAINGGYDVVSSDKISESGSTKIEVKGFEPGQAYLYIGQANTFLLFLDSGQMTISVDSTGVSFSGDRKAVNEYYYLSQKVFRSNVVINGQFILSIRDSLEQVKYLDILSDKYNELNKIVRADDKLARVDKEIILAHNEFMVEQLRARIAYQSQERPEYKEKIDDHMPLLDQIPVRPLGLKYNDEGYIESLKHLLKFNLYEPIEIYLYDQKLSEKDSLGLIASKFIHSKPELLPIREFLLAFNIANTIKTYSSVTTSVKSLYQQFKEEFPQSKYRHDLKSVFDSYSEVSEGAPAKEINAFYEDGRPFSLMDFKGKVLYIDTWATWCKPCVGEFPHSISLQKSYQDNPNVVFVFLSIDRDEQKWKNYLSNNPEFKKIGIQLRQPPTESSSEIFQQYKIWGIPHYIVIDKEGNIKENKAPRPSQSERLTALINGLL